MMSLSVGYPQILASGYLDPSISALVHITIGPLVTVIYRCSSVKLQVMLPLDIFVQSDLYLPIYQL